MTLSRKALSTARDVADQVGLGGPARSAKRLLSSPAERRNQRDDEQLHHLITLALTSSSCCVDIGANVGTMLGWIVQAAPRGQHVAFEPVPHLAHALRARHPAVDVREAAVSDTAGRTSFVVNVDQPSRSGLAPPVGRDRTEAITVEVVRLDDALPRGTRPRLIKIDVEGAELEALRGASSTIADNDVMVAFEHGHGLAEPDLDRSRELYRLLEDLGLRLFDMDGRELDRRTYERVYVDGSRWNFLARR